MIEIREEEGERDSERRDASGDEIGSDSVIERIRNCPMYSPTRSLADQVQSPPLDSFGFQFGYEAYLPPATTTVCNIEASLGYEASLFRLQSEYEAYLPPATTTVCNIEASPFGLLKWKSVKIAHCESVEIIRAQDEPDEIIRVQDEPDEIIRVQVESVKIAHCESVEIIRVQVESVKIAHCEWVEIIRVHVESVIITDPQLGSLIITDSQVESLIITDCWQLESLIITGSQLESLKITDCWQLESLIIADCWQLESLIITRSQLESLIITRSQLESLIITDSMESLTITDSQLESLIITDCSRLESIITDRSHLKSFIITHCSRLESIITDGSQLESLIITGCSRMKSIITESLQLESLIITDCSQPEWDKSIDKPINSQASFLFHSALYSQTCKLNFVGAQATRIYITVQCFIEKESNAQMGNYGRHFCDGASKMGGAKLGFFLEGRYVEAYHRSDIKYFYQSIKKFMRWLDSSEEKMFGGLGVKYIEQKVESAEKSCISISHLKRKSTTERPKKRYRTTYLITLDDLRQLFGQKRADAAKTLGGCWIGAEMNHIVKFLKVEESNAQGYSLEGRCVQANNVMDEELNSGVQYNQTSERRPGVEIIQLDSSGERIFGELGAKNIGQKVESAEKSCIAISHSKKKNTIATPKRKYRTKRSITLGDLRPLFGQKRVDAAKTLGVSVPTFKRYCRKNGITWWNGDGCSLVEPKLLNNSVHQNSSGSKPPEVQGEKEISALLGARQDAVTIKAKSEEGILKLQLSSESGLAELQEAVAKRLTSQAFIVEYEDEDQEPIMIACDEDWQACVKFFGNQVIRLAIREKISNSKKSHGSGRGLKRKRS